MKSDTYLTPACLRVPLRLSHCVLFAVALTLILACGAKADTIINFETQPVLVAQPDNFVMAGVMQTYTSPGVYTISGGVALGNPTFLSAFAANGSAPNLYGTSDIGDPSLLSTITLDLPAAENVSAVSGLLFNGQTIAEDYTVTAFSGANQVSMQTFSGLGDNTDAVNSVAGFSLTSAIANPITQVLLTTPNAANNGWNFFVDTIQIRTTTVPEPGMLPLLLGCGVSGGLLLRRHARK